MNTTRLTPEQRRALKEAREALTTEQAKGALEDDAYWRGYLRVALRTVDEAFSGDAS